MPFRPVAHGSRDAYIEPIDETIQNLDVFAPTRKDYLHLLTWMQDALPQFKA